MRAHLLRRVVALLVGIGLFYAPLALLPRLLVLATGSPLIADTHRICLRMPFEWALQPWMYRTMVEQPGYLIAPLLLPVLALVTGPLLCGWLCPAGALTELLGRLVPDRLKLSVGGRLDPTPVRLGVLAGMMLSPWLGGYVCCTFCNFTMMQNLVSAAFGDLTGLVAWSSFGIVTFVVWFFALGLLVEGGRGWCNLLCPAGAVIGLASALGARVGLAPRIRIDHEACVGCGTCTTRCPAWAISTEPEVNPAACNLCRDCLFLCPEGAIRQVRTRRTGRAPDRGRRPVDEQARVSGAARQLAEPPQSAPGRPEWRSQLPTPGTAGRPILALPRCGLGE